MSQNLFLISRDIKRIALSCQNGIGKNYEFVDKYYKDLEIAQEEVVDEAINQWMKISQNERNLYLTLSAYIKHKKIEAAKDYKERVKRLSNFRKNMGDLAKVLKNEDIDFSTYKLFNKDDIKSIEKIVSDLNLLTNDPRK